jgi:hypothetical protein
MSKRVLGVIQQRLDNLLRNLDRSIFNYVVRIIAVWNRTVHVQDLEIRAFLIHTLQLMKFWFSFNHVGVPSHRRIVEAGNPSYPLGSSLQIETYFLTGINARKTEISLGN